MAHQSDAAYVPGRVANGSLLGLTWRSDQKSVGKLNTLETLAVEKAAGARLRRELSRTAERGIAPERTRAVREDASPKRQRSKRPLSTDQESRGSAIQKTPQMTGARSG